MITRLAINGACGRMGLRLIQLAREDAELAVIAALERAHHPCLGHDIGEVAGLGRLGIPVATSLPLSERPDVIVDFSSPEGTLQVLRLALDRKIALVVGTTGHSPQQREELEAAAHHIPLLVSPNMSLAMNVLMVVLEQVARLLKGHDFDVEIVEMHHRFKKDAPSGTALQLAKIIQEQLGFGEVRHGREGVTGEKPRGEIGMHAVRAGDIVGEHLVLFSTLGESLQLVHRAHSRDCYARGALLAAKFLAQRPPGRYCMRDVLGL
ncbi:MAG: 4-hydroxy-tetrahydrodipicolinate reductase [Gemmatales bacterium]|nr:4-hydroxy-tetrahydrodipicolinate reductase [Gemmatales bacterium]MDW7994653.1 4-hydroxy-tetrahydrodipicolinate reductase [Gemmatales bacterium]